jgi:quercetin dioxygenase-like cupin family protein
MLIVEHQGQPWRQNRPGSRVQLIVDPSAEVTGLALVNQVCEPGAGAPSHTHEFDEIVTVLEGSAEVWVGAERLVVGPDTSLFVPPNTVHGFRNVGDGPLRLQATIASTELRANYL